MMMSRAAEIREKYFNYLHNSRKFDKLTADWILHHIVIHHPAVVFAANESGNPTLSLSYFAFGWPYRLRIIFPNTKIINALQNVVWPLSVVCCSNGCNRLADWEEWNFFPGDYESYRHEALFAVHSWHAWPLQRTNIDLGWRKKECAISNQIAFQTNQYQ